MLVLVVNTVLQKQGLSATKYDAGWRRLSASGLVRNAGCCSAHCMLGLVLSTREQGDIASLCWCWQFPSSWECRGWPLFCIVNIGRGQRCWLLSGPDMLGCLSWVGAEHQPAIVPAGACHKHCTG